MTLKSSKKYRTFYEIKNLTTYEKNYYCFDDVYLRLRPDEDTKLTSYTYPRLYTGETYPYYGTEGNYYRIGVNGRTYYIPQKYGRLR